jgi:hypothetical protein
VIEDDVNKEEDWKIIYNLCRILMMKPQKKIWRPYKKEIWRPYQEEIDFFHSIIDILTEYTLGLKKMIGLRQLLKNKMGEDYVNNFNKLLSSRSLLWKDPYVFYILNDCLDRKSSKFKLIVKEENQMFFICKPSILPDGFYDWNPSF